MSVVGIELLTKIGSTKCRALYQSTAPSPLGKETEDGAFKS